MTVDEIILDSIADGVFTVGEDYRITSFNAAAEKITGVSREEAIGQRCCDVFHASICETACALNETFRTGKQVVNRSIYVVSAAGKKIPLSISTALLRDAKGKVVGGVETFRDLSAVETLRRELHKSYSFEDIVSKSKEMLKIFAILPRVAESDTTVLIEGESGTGKELIARAIHNLSHRNKGPMVVLNCGALPETLLESELFGYKAGAFTGAQKDRPGRFARAEGGTLFLDEIAEVSQAMQVRLLRVLQDQTYEPLGGTETIKADVRIVAATNKRLRQLVDKDSFREDLFYRINVMRIELPPLRERKEDIPLLVEHFLEKLSNTKRKLVTSVDQEVLAALMSYQFPGNIRELENVIEHAFVLCQGTTVDRHCLPREIPLRLRSSVSVGRSVEDFERQLLLDILEKNNWKRGEAAAELKIDKSTLWRKMKRLGIKPPSRI
ncbi:MAG: sigma 54-interacting transcriptional regulator [bacterium]